MASWSPLRSSYLALSLLAAASTLTSAYHILPRQQGLPDVTICTCSSKAKSVSRTSGICVAAGGQEALITAIAEANADNAGIPPTSSWNTCYIPGSLKERAIEAFSDANCAAKFGEGFTGDCVAYPNTPGLANVPFGPAPYCQKGRDAVPDCPMTGFYSCSNPFVLPACCLSIQQICGAV